MSRGAYDLSGHAVQSRFSDPAQFAHLVTSLPVEPPGLSEVARNVIAHYRASEPVLPKATREDINLAWENGRWRLFDPELTEPRVGVPDPMDMTWSPANGRGFTSAATTWLAFRRGGVDAETFGVDAAVPLSRGARFLFNEVIIEIAHRFGDELLLWDSWGSRAAPCPMTTRRGWTRSPPCSVPRTTTTSLPSTRRWRGTGRTLVCTRRGHHPSLAVES